jgi:hypothetical protein
MARKLYEKLGREDFLALQVLMDGDANRTLTREVSTLAAEIEPKLFGVISPDKKKEPKMAWLACTHFPSHEDTFSTQVSVAHEGGRERYLVRQDCVETIEGQTRCLVSVGEFNEALGEAKVTVSCKYPTAQITVKSQQLFFKKDEG